MTLYWPGLRVNGITLWPFIIVSTPQPPASLMNHERIHIRQQAEWLLLPFYVWYVSEYYYYRLKGKSHYAAYRSISFEKEAYAFEEDPDYLKKRRFGAFLRFLK